MTKEDLEREKKLIHQPHKIEHLNPKKAACGRAPKIKKGYSGIYQWDSFSEYVFWKYAMLVEHQFYKRNDKERFLYYFDEKGKQRKWYPDFIPLAEVKGIEKPSDLRKKQAHPEVRWVGQNEINEMKKKLNCGQYPNWMDDWHNK